MLSRKLTSLLLMGIFVLGANANAAPTDAKTQSPAKSDSIPYNFHGEADKTDSYAIPSDSTEEELDEEIEELNEEAKTAHKINK